MSSKTAERTCFMILGAVGAYAIWKLVQTNRLRYNNNNNNNNNNTVLKPLLYRKTISLEDYSQSLLGLNQHDGVGMDVCTPLFHKFRIGKILVLLKIPNLRNVYFKPFSTCICGWFEFDDFII